MPDESKLDQLVAYAKKLADGRISIVDYWRHRADIVGVGEDIPDPDLAAIKSTLKQEPEEATPPPESSKTHEEWERYYLKEIASQAKTQTTLISSIRAWVVFFGILTIISLVIWVLIIAGGI